MRLLILFLVLGIAMGLASCDIAHDATDHWSMVYEAVQTPETSGGQKRFVLFNEDGLTHLECTDLFDTKLYVLNNNAAVISYEIQCEHLMTKGHGTEFQTQDNWLLLP